MAKTIHDRVDRQIKQGDDFADRMLAALDTLPADVVLTIAKLYVDEVRYLGEHFTTERHTVTKFPCSEKAYHACSFTARHDPACKAVGGNGDVSANGYKTARSCEPDCDTVAKGETWCHVSGFECADCELVDRLLRILEAHRSDFGLIVTAEADENGDPIPVRTSALMFSWGRDDDAEEFIDLAIDAGLPDTTKEDRAFRREDEHERFEPQEGDRAYLCDDDNCRAAPHYQRDAEGAYVYRNGRWVL